METLAAGYQIMNARIFQYVENFIRFGVEVLNQDADFDGDFTGTNPTRRAVVVAGTKKGFTDLGDDEDYIFVSKSFRLELEVSDSTAPAVIVLFDETARLLVIATLSNILLAESGFSASYNLYSDMNNGPFTPVVVQNPDGTATSLPNCLQSLVGSTQTFLIYSHTYYDHGGYETFNCKYVIVDDTALVPTDPPAHTPSRRQSKVVPVVPTPAKHEHSESRVLYPDSASDEDADCPGHESQEMQEVDGGHAGSK